MVPIPLSTAEECSKADVSGVDLAKTDGNKVDKYDWHTMSDRIPEMNEIVEYKDGNGGGISLWRYGNCRLYSFRCELRDKDMRVIGKLHPKHVIDPDNDWDFEEDKDDE